MRTHRQIIPGIVAALVAAATTFAAPAAQAANGYTTVVQWDGGKTKACRVDDAASGTSRVKVYWDGRAYTDDGEFKDTGAGGLAKVDADFKISGWTYSSAHAGHVGPTVSKVLPTDG